MCRCPFHDDKNPSMKADRRFHCFGCGADGDVIDLVSRLEQATPKEAALMLARDFSIPYADKWPPRRRKPRQETPEKVLSAWSGIVSGCCATTETCFAWKEDCAPKTPEDDWNPLFVEALQKQDYVDYLLDTLLSPDMEELVALIASYGEEVRTIERTMETLPPEIRQAAEQTMQEAAAPRSVEEVRACWKAPRKAA